jgi:cellulose synthase/poly-beta-1,6-N-acetylglucosamine synthase-like glycosyltransferase
MPWEVVLVGIGSAIWTFAEVYLVSMNLYLFGVSLFGLRKRKETKILRPDKTFAVIVPAHNEEAVIGETVRSVMAVDYPRERFEVLVVADNCTDATAERAREAGATVLEREDTTVRGKPEAVKFAMRHALASERRFDAVVIIDADNLLSENVLLEFSSRLIQGEQVIQAYLDTKNPNDSWITWMNAISYWFGSRFFQLGATQAGLPCQLGGTGFCISTDTLRAHGWNVTSLTDDLEYTMIVILAGIRPTWAHDAVVYDEKPLTLKASLRQRLRWMQGHWDVASRYTKPLAKKAFRDRDKRALHGTIYCLAPTRTILWGVTLVFAWVPFFAPQVLAFAIHPWPAFLVGMGAVLFFFGYPMVFLALERVPARFFLRYALMLVYMPTWIPLAALGLIRRRLKNWDKTEHTRALSLSEAGARRKR